MKTVNTDGNTISSQFTTAWAQSAMTAGAKVVMEFGNNRFNGNQTVTASSEKLVNNVYDGFSALQSHFWEPDEAFNNKNRNSMRWGVCDHGAKAWGPNSSYHPYRAVNLDDTQGSYEHGWWSANKSQGNGIFTTAEWVQCVFEAARSVNKVVLYTDEAYGNMKQVTIQYMNTSNVWIDIATGVTLGQNTYINSYSLGTATAVKGLKVIIYSTWNANDFARISEVQGVLEDDISADIVNIDVQETREQYDGTVPVGILKTATCNLELQNIDQKYSPTNTSSPYYPYISHNNRFTVAFGIDTTAAGGAGYEYVQMGEYFSDQWDLDGSGITARVGARDYGKFLQDEIIPFPKVWFQEDYAGAPDNTIAIALRDLLARAGKTPDQINIDPAALRKFDMLYANEVSYWNFIAEVAFADQGMFGFDYLGNFFYQSYNILNTAPYTTSQYTYSDALNIISGTAKTELYLNRVIVDVSPVNKTNLGLRALWSPESPTVLTWNKLSAGISDTDLAIPVQLSNATQGLFNGVDTTDMEIYLLIDNELIYCTGVTDNTFTVWPGSNLEPVGPDNPTGRGWGGTVAVSHNSGSYIGEARYYERVTWDSAPAISVKYPYFTAIDGVTLDYGPLASQLWVVAWKYDAFGATLAFANKVEHDTVVIASDAIDSFDIVTGKVRDDNLQWNCAVAGTAPIENSGHRRKGKATLANKRLIRRHGKSEITVTNPWIQSQQHADQIATSLINEYNTPRSVIELETVGFPKLELADRVTVSNFPELSIQNIDYHIINLSYQYNGGLTTNVSLREVKA